MREEELDAPKALRYSNQLRGWLLTLGFGGPVTLRAERYSDFGNASSVKLSSRYVFSPTVALRGTVSTGFRAPSLAQQFFATTSTNLINGQTFGPARLADVSLACRSGVALAIERGVPMGEAGVGQGH